MAEQESINELKSGKTGTLYVVSTPIGNDEDITLRALRVLRSCDIIVCEEPKVGARMLHKYNITQKMDLLNEQNEFRKTPELLEHLLNGKSLALTSDAGTPVFADPGFMLVNAAISKDVPVVVVPGPSSIMAALVRSGFTISQFVFAGFLSRLREERMMQLKRLSGEGRTVVLLETPYRIMPFLEAAASVMPHRQAYIGCNLTMAFETHHYGTFEELLEKFRTFKFKGEFVVCFEGKGYKEEPGPKSYEDVGEDTEFPPVRGRTDRLRFDRDRVGYDRGSRDRGAGRSEPRKEWSRDRDSDRRPPREGRPEGDRWQKREGRPDRDRSERRPPREGRPDRDRGERRPSREGRPDRKFGGRGDRPSFGKPGRKPSDRRSDSGNKSGLIKRKRSDD